MSKFWRPSPALLALYMLIAGLWLAGGASRPDVLGQFIVRGLSCLILIMMALTGPRPSRAWLSPPAFILGAALLLVILQLVPLPPAMWEALPGRTFAAEAAAISGQAQPWRPWTLVPGATLNAAASLVTPIAMFVLASALAEREREGLLSLLLSLVVAEAAIGLFQVSGVGFTNPMVNATPGAVSGMFANRNHFALFLAIGCLLAPVWAFAAPERAGWRVPLAAGLTTLLVLLVLASGSRAGLGLTALALVIAVVLAWRPARRLLQRYPRWLLPAVLGGLAAAVIALVATSIAAGRAASVSRLFAVDPGQDMRQRALPTLMAMARDYLPWGAGVGSFDPVFRIHEPDTLLKPTHFNHAHNDFLEVVLDAGVPGMALMALAIGWWAWASIAAWRPARQPRYVRARLGSGILLLVAVASGFDYPARTPLIMAVIVVAALWLAEARRPALPAMTSHL